MRFGSYKNNNFEKFAFIIVRIVELFAREVCEFLKMLSSAKFLEYRGIFRTLPNVKDGFFRDST